MFGSNAHSINPLSGHSTRWNHAKWKYSPEPLEGLSNSYGKDILLFD